MLLYFFLKDCNVHMCNLMFCVCRESNTNWGVRSKITKVCAWAPAICVWSSRMQLSYMWWDYVALSSAGTALWWNSISVGIEDSFLLHVILYVDMCTMLSNFGWFVRQRMFRCNKECVLVIVCEKQTCRSAARLWYRF